MTIGIIMSKKVITLAGKIMFIMGEWKINWRELIMDTVYLNDFLKIEPISTYNTMAAIRIVLVFDEF